MICKKCKTELVNNNYHLALELGASLYCNKCGTHQDSKGRRVLIICDCGCGYKEKE